MQKRWLIVSVLATGMIYGCQNMEEGYSVTVDLEEAGGRWVHLTTRVERQYLVIDSVLAEAGLPAVMTGKLDGLKTVYLSVEGARNTIRLLLENGDYSITGNLEEPRIETTSKAQNDLNVYNEKAGELDQSLTSLVESYYGAMEKENQQEVDSILALYEQVAGKKEELDSLFLIENPSSFASVLLLRGSFYSLDLEEFEKALSSLDPSLRQMEEYQYMAELLERQREVAVGQPYKDFGLKTPEGDLLRISDVHQGNVLLIDFWASWCGPCRRANPELVQIYSEYSERGFEIIGVSLDRDTASWINAIEEDQLAWHHISDVQYWDSEGAKLYGVPAIPHTVIIDREGIIAAKKIHGKELRQTIESLL